jgi:hypothetical protein
MSVVIESGFTGTAYGLSTPRIAAFPLSGTITASTEATGFDAENAADGQTWTYWKPTAVPATWDLTFTSAAVSYVGVAAHNCGTVGATVLAQRWDGAAWVTVATVTPTDDSPIVFLLTRRTAQTTFRVRFTGAIPTVGVIMIGDVTEFPLNCRFVDGLPFNEAVQSVYADNISDGGHVVDRFEVRKAVPVSMTVNNLSETWVAATLVPLAAHMAGNPVFMADRPGSYAKSVAFGMATEPVQARRTLAVAGASRSVTINLAGFAA